MKVAFGIRIIVSLKMICHGNTNFFFFLRRILVQVSRHRGNGGKKNHITIHVKKKKVSCAFDLIKKKKEKNDQEIEFSWNCQE